jgi:hypothetical protein
MKENDEMKMQTKMKEENIFARVEEEAPAGSKVM